MTMTLSPSPKVQLASFEGLLSRPFYVSRGWLRLDPEFRPLDGHPRFDALVREGSAGLQEPFSAPRPR